MQPVRLFFSLLLAGASAGAMAVPASAAAQDPVTVEYVQPHDFAESRNAGWSVRYDHGNYLEQLKAFLQHKAAPMLQPGQHLAIRITDIDLAGGFEPGRMPGMEEVRIMRDIYPPRIDLEFTLTDAGGKVIRSGERKLVELGYLHTSPGLLGDSDPLRYDKALLDRWLRRGPAKW